MTLIPLILAVGLSLFIAKRVAQQRAEIVQLARVYLPARKPTLQPKDEF